MRSIKLLLLCTASLTASACATTSGPARSGALPVCDGRHRRAANPYGSVLAEGADGKSVAPAAAGSLSPAKPPLSPAAQGGHARLETAFAPCGGSA